MSALLGGAVGLLFLFIEPPQLQLDPVVRQDLPVREAVAILAALAGAAVARASGGWRAVALVGAVFALNEAGSYTLQQWQCTRIGDRLPGGSLFDLCPTPARMAIADVPRVAGGIVGLLIAPLIRARPHPPWPLLIAAAVVPIWDIGIRLATTAFSPVRAGDVSISVALTVLYTLMWVAVGAAVRIFRGGPRSLVVLALTVVLPAAFTLRLAIVVPAPVDMRFWQLLGPALNVASVAALVAGWVAVGARWLPGTADAPSTRETDS